MDKAYIPTPTYHPATGYVSKWVTVAQLQEKKGITASEAKAALQQLHELGKAQTQKEYDAEQKVIKAAQEKTKASMASIQKAASEAKAKKEKADAAARAKADGLQKKSEKAAGPKGSTATNKKV